MGVRKALEPQCLDSSDGSPHRPNNRNLCCCEGNQRWNAAHSFDPQPRGPELEYVAPKIKIFALAVPLDLAEGRRHFSGDRQPIRSKGSLVPLVPVAVLANEADLPVWESSCVVSRVARKQIDKFTARHCFPA